MANFTSLAQYIATITARFNKPRRNLINEGLLKTDIIEALSDAGKWAEDVRLESQALNSSFIERSLTLSTRIYVNGVTGNDANTGLGGPGGSVRTLTRAAQLLDGKCVTARIEIVGNTVVTEDANLEATNIIVFVGSGVTVDFKKKEIPGVGGEGTAGINVKCVNFQLMLSDNTTINIENHSPYASGSSSQYSGNQGIVRMLGITATDCLDMQSVYINNRGTSKINVGDNCVISHNGSPFGVSSRIAACNFRFIGTGIVLSASARLSTGFASPGTFNRLYHPTSSTDANVSEGETVLSPTNNKLWSKRGGTIRDAMGTTFA